MFVIDVVVFSNMAIIGLIIEQCGYYPMVKRLIEMHYRGLPNDAMVRYDRLTVAAQDVGGSIGSIGLMAGCTLYFSHVLTHDAANFLPLTLAALFATHSLVKANKVMNRPSRFLHTARR
jgi:hypothetical protein